MRERKLFIAGATGATGRTLVRLAPEAQVDIVPHVRPKSAGRTSFVEQAAVLELDDEGALVEALRPCTTVVQLIGTMRKRFASGDTYETSDIGTTRTLAAAARKAGCDHFVLLSSVGAGRPLGAYLKAKAEAERIARQSGLDWTILRPSAFEGEGHKLPLGGHFLASTFGGARFRPIRVEQLARAILHVGKTRSPVEAVLEGRSLWSVVEAAGG